MNNNVIRCVKQQKVTVISEFHNKDNKGKLTEHNFTIEVNISSETVNTSEEKISLSFERWNVTIMTCGLVIQKCRIRFFIAARKIVFSFFLFVV